MSNEIKLLILSIESQLKILNRPLVILPRCRRLERNQLQVKHKQDWDRGFILLLPQAAVLPGSDAGSDTGIEFGYPKPSDLVLHVVPDVWGTLLERGLWFVQRRNLVKERDPICA